MALPPTTNPVRQLRFESYQFLQLPIELARKGTLAPETSRHVGKVKLPAILCLTLSSCISLDPQDPPKRKGDYRSVVPRKQYT